MERLRARLYRLALVEAANVVLVPGLVLSVLGQGRPFTAGVLVGAAALAVSLAAGALYWFRRARGPVGLGWCRVCEGGLVVAVVLAVGAVVRCVVELVGTDAVLMPVAGLGFALFTAGEVVNYRFVQISGAGWRYWGRGRVRRPHLARDLGRARRNAAPVPG